MGTIYPNEKNASQTLEVKARQFAGELHKAETRLSEVVHDLIVLGAVELYSVKNKTNDGVQIVACHKSRLAFLAAEKLEEGQRQRFCSSGGKFVLDQHLEKALKNSGVMVEQVKARRASDDKKGDYYVIQVSSLQCEPIMRGELELES